jgi:hypothetical protein
MGGRWDDSQDNEILQKIENLDNLSVIERYQIVNHIIFKYMRLKSMKFNIKSFEEVCKTYLLVIKEAEFREFAFNRYHVFIYHDGTGKSVYISNISNEELSLISNKGSLTDDELLIKVIGIIRKTRFFQGKLAGYLNRDKRMDKA